MIELYILKIIKFNDQYMEQVDSNNSSIGARPIICIYLKIMYVKHYTSHRN